MNKESNGSITSNQFCYMLVGAMLGVQTLFVPNYYIKNGKQDAWICTIVGGIFPVYMVLLASFMCRRFPEDNVLKLGKKFLGKFIGSTYEVLYLVQMCYYTAVRCSQLSNMLRVFISYFITMKLVHMLIIIAAVYTCYKGVKVIARGSEVIHYFTLIMLLVPLGAFTRGDPHNLMPVFKTNPSGLALASIRAGYDYFGINAIFILYPFMKNKTHILKEGIKASVISVSIMTWFTFSTIYYFGVDIMPKYLWVVVETSKAFRMMTIKNFTFIFIFFWTMIVLTNISIGYFSGTLILNELWSRINMEKYALILAPLIFYISLKMGNEVISRTTMSFMVPFFTLINTLYATVVAIVIRIKGPR